MNIPCDHVHMKHVHFGRQAGTRVDRAIRQAKRNVLVMSPYIDNYGVEHLLSRYNDGVYVSLITSSDIDKTRNADQLRSMLLQIRHVDEKKVRRRTRLRNVGLVYGMLVCIVPVILCWLLHWAWLFLWAALVLLKPLIYFYRTTAIYSYSYTCQFDFAAIMSPYSHGREGPESDEYYLAHSKLYLIDDEVAFIGSLNFTKAGFFKNHETCIEIRDRAFIKELKAHYMDMFNAPRTRYLSMDYVGSKLYQEPIN